MGNSDERLTLKYLQLVSFATIIGVAFQVVDAYPSYSCEVDYVKTQGHVKC